MFDAKTRNFIKSLRCPICQSKIDLHDYKQVNNKLAGNENSFNFNCIKVASHYQVWFEHWKDIKKVSDDQVEIYFDSRVYLINQEYLDGKRTYITLFNGKKRLKTEFFQSVIFDWQKMDEEKIINRLKTILTFR